MNSAIGDEGRVCASHEKDVNDEVPRPSRKDGNRRAGLRVRFRSKDDIYQLKDTVKTEAEVPVNSLNDSHAPARRLQHRFRPENSDNFAVIVLVCLFSSLLAQFIATGKGSFLLGAEAMPDSIFSAHAKRADGDPTDYCKKWSQQSAIVNGTLYLYGGRKSTSSSQTSGTWTNDFLTIDLTKTWQIATPLMSGLAQPSGPPAVANGYLWNSYDSLYLYGGEFSDSPIEYPVAFGLWEYDIASSSWSQQDSPQTAAAVNSELEGQAIQRAAEGAGFNLASLGRGWYFGGHLDFLTTEGWSIQTARIYLKSFVEFTFPGVSNEGLTSKSAGSGGAWRNITSAGIQTQAGFEERADGLLVFVPGFSTDGILLALAGGTNETFTQMNAIDVYDIANSRWYKQTTSGKSPGIRVNPCAVVAAAADGSSYNVYMFGGQNLIPYGEQTQYDDMWILSVPSFQWIQVDMNNQSVPYGRSGHTCNVRDAQMIMVGGYTGQQNALTCEQPGVYVFDLSTLQWMNQFTSTSAGTGNVHSQQTSQEGTTVSDGLEGSYGYQVPAAVQSVIGGNGDGGATVTAPINTATAGPLATGKPRTYSIGSGGSAGGNQGSEGSGSGVSKSNRGSIIGAIVAGVFGFIFLIGAIYFAICAMIYRKQLALYRHHIDMMREQNAEKGHSPYTGGIYGGRGFESPVSSRRPGRDGLLGPYHQGSESIETESTRRHETESAGSSSVDLLEGMQPSFWGWNGVLLHPRRSLRIVNRDEAPPPREDE